MADDAIFETRLAGALGRYAELAPAMDDEAIARAAIDAGGRTERGGWTWLRDALLGPTAQSRAVRVVYLVGAPGPAACRHPRRGRRRIPAERVPAPAGPERGDRPLGQQQHP